MKASFVRSFYTYIMTNVSGRAGTLYVGVTNNLERRVWEHRTGIGSEFVKTYRLHRLVWCQEFSSIADAIGAEKRIKGWTRVKKITLIEEMNPHWEDLARDWYT